MSEPASGFDAETRARIDCAEQFDETGTHLADCPRAHPQEGGATGMSEPLTQAERAELVAEVTRQHEQSAFARKHMDLTDNSLLRYEATVAALTAENERDRHYLIGCPWCGERMADRPARQQIAHLIDCGDRAISRERAAQVVEVKQHG